MNTPSKTHWARAHALPDAVIDAPDTLPRDADCFADAVRWPGHKQQITLRLDPDVLAFFKAQGKGYQTTINAVLRQYMQAQKQQATPRKSAPDRPGASQRHKAP